MIFSLADVRMGDCIERKRTSRFVYFRERCMTTFILRTALLLLLLAPLPLYGTDNIIVMRSGEKDTQSWNSLSKYLSDRRYVVNMYDATDTIERQIDMANRVNRQKSLFVIVLQLVPSDRTDAFIAVSDLRKGKGRFLDIEEVSGLHGPSSRELGTAIASRFQKDVMEVSLFPLLGINMPGVFVRLDLSSDRPVETFEKLHEGIQDYLKRGTKDETKQQRK